MQNTLLGCISLRYRPHAVALCLLLLFLCGCEQRKPVDAKLANYKNSFAHPKKIDKYIEILTQAGDYQDAPKALKIFQALKAGDHKGAVKLYLDYRQTEKIVLSDLGWMFMVEENFIFPPLTEAYKTGLKLSPPESALVILRDLYNPVARLYYPPDNYFNEINAWLVNKHYRFGFETIEEVLELCGKAPKGKVLIYGHIMGKTPGTSQGIVYYTEMAMIGDELYPENFAEVEYLVDVNKGGGVVGKYTDGSSATGSSFSITLTRLPDKKVLFKEYAFSGSPSAVISKQTGSRHADVSTADKRTVFKACMAALQNDLAKKRR